MSDTAACRILVIASTTDQAQQFVQRVKTISRPSFTPIIEGYSLPGRNDTRTEVNKMDDTESTTIPWTIANKYYTADVHFEARELSSFVGYHACGVPAVIYVWNRGESYREIIPALAQKLEYYDPEVSLVVGLSPISNSALVVPYDEEDSLDEFISSHGFEYVDGDRQVRQPLQDGQSFSDEDSIGVPGLPRVIDALSTIMWPSMIQSTATSARKSRARELLDWAREEEGEDGLRALISSQSEDDAHFESGTLQPHESRKEPPTKSRMQREMEELERWLEEDDLGRRKMEDAEVWGGVNTFTKSGDTEAWGDLPTPTALTPAADKTAFGFEDDFAEFVGAPLEVSYGSSRLSSQRLGPLQPMHTGASYSSLASDFNDSEIFDKEAEKDGGFPSQEEIKETSRRIFGASVITSNSTGTSSENGTPDTDTFMPLPDDLFTPSDTEDLDDEEYEMGAFDLSRVLGALQGMKEEISGMTDEDERRKAAARVALGLVYGLRKEEERGGVAQN